MLPLVIDQLVVSGVRVVWLLGARGLFAVQCGFCAFFGCLRKIIPSRLGIVRMLLGKVRLFAACYVYAVVRYAITHPNYSKAYTVKKLLLFHNTDLKTT